MYHINVMETMLMLKSSQISIGSPITSKTDQHAI